MLNIKMIQLMATTHASQNPQLLRPLKNNQRGLATLETMAMTVMFMVFIGYMLGSFGIVHTGILNSIAARTYAFETFRHRSNIVYFRDSSGPDIGRHYQNLGVRVHAIQSEGSELVFFYSTARPMAIAMFGDQRIIGGRADRVTDDVRGIASNTRNEDVEVNPAWVRVKYGICINSQCDR